jgi:hypothetical protein
MFSPRPLLRVALLTVFAVTAIAQTSTPTKPTITSYDSTSSTPSFHGTADPGVTISVSFDTDPPDILTTTAAADGTWNLTWSGAPLLPGTCYVRAYATNAAGVKSATTDFVIVKVPPTHVPVIQPIADQETTWRYLEKDYFDELLMKVSNFPTNFTATGLPPGTEMVWPDPTGIQYTYGGITGGKFHITVTASNQVGTSDPVSFNWIIHPGMTDYIIPNSGNYAPGDVLELTTKWSTPVVVTGTPAIPLWGTKQAVYTSGSGTNTLKFTYTIAADDPTLSASFSDLILDGGSISTADGVPASLHATFYFGSPPSIHVTNPTPQPATIVSAAVSGPTSSGGHTVGGGFTFNQNITVSGPVSLHFKVGGVARTVALTPYSTNELTFNYTPQPGDEGTLELESPLEGAVVGANGLPANLAFTPPETSAIFVDGNPPEIPVISSATQSGMPLFTGTAEPNSHVKIVVSNGVATYLEGTAGDDGRFTTTWPNNVPPFPAGTYSFAATATNLAGQTSTASAPVTVVVSYAQKPNAPTITNTSTTGSSGIAVSGTSDPGTTIYLFLDAGYTHFATTYADRNGHWSTSWYANPAPTQPSVTFTAISVDSMFAASDRSAPVTYFSQPPSVQDATVDGQVGTAISPVQLTATNSPTLFSAPDLANYGLSVSSSGVVSGTPTQAANGTAVSFTASNSAGQSAPGTITLNIAAAPGSPPPDNPPPGTGQTSQTITFSSPTGAVRVGQSIALGATSSAGLPITYSVVSGDATINGNVLTPQSTATLIVRASSPGDGTYAAASTDVNFGNPIPVGNSRLVNISSRVRVSAGDASGATIAGFYVTGTTPKQILIRAAGPSLTQFGITNPVTAPQLKLYDNKNAVIATNAGWNNDAAISAAADSVAAFKFNANSADAALLMTLAPGLYTAQVQSGNTGTALVEVYDVGSADPNPTKQLINISTRGYVGTDQDVLVAGFVVSGDAPKRILIRGVGLGIKQFGVADVVADPVLKLYDAKQVAVAQNDNWEAPQSIGAGDTPATGGQITAADTAVGAFPLATGSTDAAMIVTLNPGQYTAIVSGANGGTGNAIVEVYEVP